MSKKVVAMVNIPTNIKGKKVALPGGKMRVVKPLEELYEGDPFIDAYPSMVIMREAKEETETFQGEPSEQELLVEGPIAEADVEEEEEDGEFAEDDDTEIDEPRDEQTMEEKIDSYTSKKDLDELAKEWGIDLDRRKKLEDMKADFKAELANK